MVKVVALDAMPASISQKNETLISLILDETGSMSSIKKETINSVNEYLYTQKNLNDSHICKVSLYTFSDVSSHTTNFGMTANTTSNKLNLLTTKFTKKDSIRTIYENVEISNAKEISTNDYTPSGMTNLYDAIGNTIARLDAFVTENQNVLVVIITDGYENSSVEYNVASVKKLIEERQAKGWTFVYLGANQDAWAVGSSIGLSKGQTLSYSTSEMSGTMSTLATATSMYRSTRSAKCSVETNFFKETKNGE